MNISQFIKIAITTLVCLLGYSILKGQSIIPDSTFNSTGIKSFNFYNNIDRGFACVVQADEKIVMVGLSKYPVSGSFQLCFIRLKTDGTPDSSFSLDGIAYVSMGNQGSIGGQTPVLKIASDGKIVAANTGRDIGGQSQDIMVCKLDTNGLLDPTFNGNGVLFVDMMGTNTQPDEANAMDMDSLGNIYVTGATRTGGSPLDNDFAVIKVTSSGQLDQTFDLDGKKLYDPSGLAEFGTGIKVQPDGKIVFGGSAGGNAMVLRVDSSGVLDPSFNATGYNTFNFSNTSSIYGLDLTNDGKIVAAGVSSGSNDDIGVARFLNNGSLDSAFGSFGKTVFPISALDEGVTSMLLTPDNKMLIGGFGDHAATGIDFLAVMVDTTGHLDSSFNSIGYVSINTVAGNIDDQANGITRMNDGRIIMAGTIIYGSAINEDVVMVRLKVGPAISTGFNEIEEEIGFSFYPNPTGNKLQFNATEPMNLYIVDLEGQLIKYFHVLNGSSFLDVTDLSNGIYLIYNPVSGMASRFVKQ